MEIDQDICVGSRRTRSQVVPDWSITESLILVNEIAAVYGDCLDAISSHQKWKIIAENCTLLDVVRNANQCRRKWESLLVDYGKIEQYEAQLSHDPYWSLEPNQRREFGLPLTFDLELFKGIDNLRRQKQARSETDTENDPEDCIDAVETAAVAKSGVTGSKRKKGLLTPQEISILKKPIKCKATPRKNKPGNSRIKHLEEEDKTSESFCLWRKADEAIRDAILRENAEQIISIVNRTGATEKDEEDSDVTHRRQGDQLIACLGDIISALGEPCFDAV